MNPLLTRSAPAPVSIQQDYIQLGDLLDALDRGEIQGFYSAVVEVTPEVALQILTSRNSRNRKLKPKRVAQYRNDMAERTFLWNGQSISFGTDKILSDGQNRCMACVKSGVPFITTVSFNVPDPARTTIDDNAARNITDVFEMQGEAYARILSNTVGLLSQYDREGSLRQQPAKSIMSRYLHANPQTRRHVDTAKSIKIPKEYSKVTKGHLAFLLASTEKLGDIDVANEFIRQFISGVVWDEHGGPARLRRFLNETKFQSSNREEIIHAMITFYNLFAENENPPKFKAVHTIQKELTDTKRVTRLVRANELVYPRLASVE